MIEFVKEIGFILFVFIYKAMCLAQSIRKCLYDFIIEPPYHRRILIAIKNHLSSSVFLYIS